MLLLLLCVGEYGVVGCEWAMSNSQCITSRRSSTHKGTSHLPPQKIIVTSTKLCQTVGHFVVLLCAVGIVVLSAMDQVDGCVVCCRRSCRRVGRMLSSWKYVVCVSTRSENACTMISTREELANDAVVLIH